MKNLFAASLFALTVSISSVSFASSPITAKHQKQAIPATVTFAQVVKSKLDVVVDNIANAKMTIRLTDALGKSIATKTLSGNETGTRVRFDLSKLTDGVYQVKIWDGFNTQVQKIEVKTAALPVSANQTLAIM